jgi:nicotinamidase-related amidase
MFPFSSFFASFNAPRYRFVAQDKHPIVHVAIDVQRCFLLGLPDQRATALSHDIRTFANALRRYDIPTVWVAYRTPWASLWPFLAPRTQPQPVGLYAPDPDHSDLCFRHGDRRAFARDELVAQLGLEAIRPRADEPIAVKTDDDAFQAVWYQSQSALDLLLRRWKTERALITGMNTHACVASTLLGCAAERPDIAAVAVYDLLADTENRAPRDLPAYHAALLQQNLPPHLFSLETSDSLLQAFAAAKRQVGARGPSAVLEPARRRGYSRPRSARRFG